jgi:peptidoglycan/LPS O-acetylase OafA/YrhL
MTPKLDRPSINYRPELDGLRGIAIIAVVLFHAGNLLPGGFVGVDSFFVLSGYLITKIIFAEYNQGEFSYLSFIERRVRRLFPAMVSLIVITVVAGYQVLMPLDLKSLCVSTIAVLCFASNFYFHWTSGYFDTASELKPLLHTWSLSLEEQFYILFPIWMGVMSRFSKKLVFASLLIIALLSFAASVRFSNQYPSSCFYLLPTRGWELLTGVLLAYLPVAKKDRQLLAEATSVFGLVLLCYSFFYLNSGMTFPGSVAGFPVLGTALIIGSNFFSQASHTATALSCLPLRFLGLVSYSLYLWHWPVLVYARYKYTDLNRIDIAVLIILSVAIATISWWFVEQPIRKKKFLSSRGALFSAALALSCVIAVVSVQGHVTKGFPERFEQDIGLLVEDTQWNGSQYELPLDDDFSAATLPNLGTCGNGDKLDFVVWGDSHAMVLSDVFRSIADDAGLCGTVIATHSVAPVPGIAKSHKLDLQKAMNRNEAVMDFLIREKPRRVFLVARWGAHFDLDLCDTRNYFKKGIKDKLSDLDDTTFKRSNKTIEELFQAFIRRLIETGIQVIIVAQIPETGESNNATDFLKWYTGRKPTPPAKSKSEVEHLFQQRYATRLFNAAQEVGALFIDTSQQFFDINRRTINYADSRAYYRDADHVTRWGAERLREAIAEQLRN